MADNPKTKLPIQVIFAIILVIATIIAVGIATVPKVLPMVIKPTVTVNRIPTSTPTILTQQPFTETVVMPTDTPSSTATSSMTPADTPTSTLTSTPTYSAKQLPDLTVTGISDPICVRDQRVIPEKDYIKFSLVVRNIGYARTRTFGPFSVLVSLILGERRYSLDEWAKGFDGVVSRSNMDIPNLNPKGDIKLNVAIDLKGSTTFGIEVIANSGLHTIPESDMTNNTLIQGYSMIC